MAINSKNYENLGFWEVHGIQKVYIEDYQQVKLKLEAASKLYKSGQTHTAVAFKKVEKLVRMKLGILEDINALGRILDERDGTITTAQAAS